jgi:hypothetical protein
MRCTSTDPSSPCCACVPVCGLPLPRHCSEHPLDDGARVGAQVGVSALDLRLVLSYRTFVPILPGLDFIWVRPHSSPLVLTGGSVSILMSICTDR